MTYHPDPVAVRLLLEGQPLMDQVVRHLEVCPDCRLLFGLAAAEAARADRPMQEPVPSSREPVESPWEAEEAARFLNILLALRRDRWKNVIEDSCLLASVPFAERLLQHGAQRAGEDPQDAESEALFVLSVTDHLPVAVPERVVAGLRTRAWSLIGLCRQRQGDGPGVETAFANASRLLRDHLGSLEEAQFCLGLARTYREADRLSEALALAARAAAVASAFADTALHEQAIEAQVSIHRECGDPLQGVSLLASAVLAAEAVGDPEKGARLRHRLALTLLVLGRYRLAAEVLAAGALGLSAAEPPRLFVFLCGLLKATRGEAQAAERYFLALLNSPPASSFAFDAALAALALAASDLRNDQRLRPRRLARVFRRLAEATPLAPESRAALARLAGDVVGDPFLSLGRLMDAAEALRFSWSEAASSGECETTH